MREIKALSPTSIMLFWRNPELWYLKYLVEPRLPSQLQTRPMSVGSAFDAFIKATLYQRYYGQVPVGHPFSAKTLLEKQVDPHNLEWATEAGLNCLSQYERSGALADLLLETSELPKFEFPLREKLTLDGLDVPITGIPDMYYTSTTDVILDWKVNGYCAKSMTSPAPGYIMCRDGWDFSRMKPSRTHRKSHPDVIPRQYHGIKISNVSLETAHEDWATQTATYAWLLGIKDYVAGIEQLCGVPNPPAAPNLRIASHRAVISTAFQETLAGKYAQCWLAYKSGHIFLTESRAASDDKCAFLTNVAKVLMEGPLDTPEFVAAIDFLRGKDFYDTGRDWRGDIMRARGITESTGDSAPQLGDGLIGLKRHVARPSVAGDRT